jgi:hypothetical protein
MKGKMKGDVLMPAQKRGQQIIDVNRDHQPLLLGLPRSVVT